MTDSVGSIEHPPAFQRPARPRAGRACYRPGALALVLGLASLSGCRPQPETDAAPSGDVSAPSKAAPLPSGRLPRVQPAPSTTLGTLPSLAPLVAVARKAVVTVRSWARRTSPVGRVLEVPAGLGTGFFYDAGGFLLTNHHVIESASRIEVKLADGREMDARLVGKDPPTDVAVLRVSGSGYAALPIGDSRALAAGDWVVAIGTPFGLEHTASAGIVSAKGRTRDDVSGLDPSGYFNFIQTDAAINVGCSGGPLLNLAGQAIGINAAVRERANNIGFAIPMEMVMQLLPRLLRQGSIRRSGIGIAVHNLSEADAKAIQGGRAGAKIIQVFNDRAGERAGLRVGDIVLTFGDEVVDDKNELRWLASIAGVGKRVPLTIVRGGKRLKVNVTLEALPSP